MSWRDKARPIIAKVLLEMRGHSPEEIDDAIFAAYPFGIRRYHPYKIWLDEVKRQRHTRKPDPVDPRQISIEEVYGTLEIR